MKKEVIKNVVIVVLVLVIAGLIVYMTLNNTNQKNSFLTKANELQANLSFYVGQTMAETFNAYDKTQILLAKSGDKEIKSMDDKALTPLCEENSKKEKDGKVYYKLNKENVKTVLKIDLSENPELTYYVQDGSYIRVVLENEPSWWNKEYNVLKVHF